MRDDYEDIGEEEREELRSDADEGPAAAEEVDDTLAKLNEALEQKSREAAEANDKYLRTYADFENYRKRMQRDLADFRKYANEQLAYELLGVIDHLGLALKHAADAGEANEGLRTGVELVYKQFLDTLEKFGVKAFRSEGEPFDPAKHDAVMQVPTADAPENVVVQVFQEGYVYYDKVLRHAKVGVSKKPEAEAAAAEQETCSD